MSLKYMCRLVYEIRGKLDGRITACPPAIRKEDRSIGPPLRTHHDPEVFVRPRRDNDGDHVGHEYILVVPFFFSSRMVFLSFARIGRSKLRSGEGMRKSIPLILRML